MKKRPEQGEPRTPAIRRVHLDTKQTNQRSSGFMTRLAGFFRLDMPVTRRDFRHFSARLWPVAMVMVLLLSAGGTALLTSKPPVMPRTGETSRMVQAERSELVLADTELDTYNVISRGNLNRQTVSTIVITETTESQPVATAATEPHDAANATLETIGKRITGTSLSTQPEVDVSSATTNDLPVLPAEIAVAVSVEPTVDVNGVVLEKLAPDQFAAVDQRMYIKVNLARVRSEPVSTATAVATAAYADRVTRTGIGSDWSRIRLADGKTGYVLSEFLTATAIAKPTPTPTPKPTATPTPKPTPKPTAKPTPKPTVTPTPKPVATTTATTTTATSPTTTPTTPATGGISAADQAKMIALAKSALGVPYVYSGSSMSGFDCSGFTRYIYTTMFHITLPHSSREQSLSSGIALAKPFSLSAMKVGDIICFDWSSPSGVCDHVGLYIGGGQYIHASSSAGKVVESTLNLSRNPIVAIRRIIK